MKLIIAEKPSLARTVARVIGIIKDNSKTSGHIECKDGYVVTWVFGHIIKLYEPDEYDNRFKSWDVGLLPIIPETWKYQTISSSKTQFNNIKGLLKSATVVINCGDPDREGQLLVDELLLHLKVKLPVKRLLILDPKDSAIRNALDNMEDNRKYYSWYQAGLLRSQADWLIGMNFTRAFTKLGNRSGTDGVISVGRVQTPTLKLIYDRHLAIQNYKPLNYYNLLAEFMTAAGDIFSAKLDLNSTGLALDSEGRLLSDNELNHIAAKITGKSGVINQYEVKTGETPPPSLFKLSDLQAIANAKLGLSADETLKLAQSLYEKQLITYPRTACGYLPESLHGDAEKILKEIGMPYLITQVFEVNPKLKSKAFDDRKLDGESHFAIIPTGYMSNVEKLSKDELGLFDIIRIQYILQFLPNLKYEQTTGSVNCENYQFNFNGKVIKSLGWKELQNAFYAKTAIDENENIDSQKLPPLTLGQNVKYLSHNIQKSTTTKPKPYTEGSLIKAMANIHNLLDEIVKSYYGNSPQASDMAIRYKKVLKDTAGLGTEATRAKTINTLKERDFIVVKNKNLEITSKGIQFMELLTKDKNLLEFSMLTSPLTTAIYEQQLDGVLKNSFTAEQFNQNVVKLLNDKIAIVKSLLAGLPESARKSAGPTTGDKCPDCGADVVERDGKYGKFKSCSGYPKCKWAPPKSIPKHVAGTAQKCHACKTGTLVVRTSKKGKFLGCNTFPKCKYIEPFTG